MEANISKKKRCLIFSLVYFPDFIGGAEVAIKEITDRVSDVEFDMVTLRLKADLPMVEKIGNITVHRVGWTGSKVSPDSLPFFLHLNKYALLWNGFKKAIELHKKNRYDFVWSVIATYNSFAALFFKLRFPKVKFLLTLQEGDPIPYIKKRALPLWPLFKMIFTKADCIQTISKYLADFAREMGAKCPVEVVPNAVDVSLFGKEEKPEAIQKWKEIIGKQEGDIFLVTASRLVTKNATEDSIRALSHLPENVKFAIAGIGYDEPMLRSEVKRLGLQNRVIFLGKVSHAELPAILKASDIFIRPSLSEGFGNSFVEAMAAKLPVIATPVGGIVDFLRDGETGFVCEPGNPQSIADAVKRILFDESKTAEVVDNAHKMVIEKYDWNIIAEQMKGIFDEFTTK